MPWVAALAGGAAAIGGGVLGANAQKDAANRASDLAQTNAERFYNIPLPNKEDMMLQLEQLKAAGVLTPEMEQNILQDPTQMAQFQNEDPRLRQADLDALGTLSKISSSGGMDAQAQLANTQAQNAYQQQARGSREANMMNAAQRGVAGSGLEFTSNQMADQNAANQTYMAGLQNAASANQRDLSALGQLTNLSGSMNSQDLARQSAYANAQDAINRFNTQSQQSTQAANVGAANTAQAANLQNAQNISNYNTGLANQQQMYNKGLNQQQFNNQMEQAKGAAGLTSAGQSADYAQGQAGANLWGGLGQAAAGTGSSIMNYYQNQNNNQALIDALKAK